MVSKGSIFKVRKKPNKMTDLQGLPCIATIHVRLYNPKISRKGKELLDTCKQCVIYQEMKSQKNALR